MPVRRPSVSSSGAVQDHGIRQATHPPVGFSLARSNATATS